MHKAVLLVAILLSACSQPPAKNSFSHGFADRARAVMEQCAQAIAKAPYPLTPAQANWHYQRCLVQNNATI